MTEQEIKCTSCGGNSVNMSEEPSVLHSPTEHNWYGQSHTVTIAMFCEDCQREFSIKIEAYKCRAMILYGDSTVDQQNVTLEQECRNILERAGVENAQHVSTGNLIEMVTLLSELHRHRTACNCGKCGKPVRQDDMIEAGLCNHCFYFQEVEQ